MPDTDNLILNLLGPLECTLGGAPIALRYDKLRALLAYLAVEAGRPHRRDALAALLWPEATDADARRSLSQALFNLRQALGDAGDGAGAPYLLATRESIQMNPDRDYVLHVARFRQLLAETARHGHAALEGCAECLARQEEAATLYRGDFPQQLAVGDSAAFEEWALLQREALRRLALGVLEPLVTPRETQGDLDAARDYARRQLVIEPWREESHRHLMRLLAAGGQRNAALAQYETCRRVLADELSVEPAPEPQALYAQIRSGELATTAGQPRPALPMGLPSQPTLLFGRDAEIAAGGQQLSLPEVRLLTLTGPGGVGKTRLAIAIAGSALADYPDSVWFVDLAAVTDAELVSSAVANTLGVVEAPGEPLAATLAGLVGERRLLLVLDNFEQVLAAAGWVAELLERTRGLKVLVTSRERLRLRWERTLPVAPLPLPDLGQPEELAALARVPSAALFVDRARAANPSFRLAYENARVVADICAHQAGCQQPRPGRCHCGAAGPRVTLPVGNDRSSTGARCRRLADAPVWVGPESRRVRASCLA